MWTLSRHRSKLTLRQTRSQLELLVLERTEALQALSQRLLRVQDEERRRVARDLHDSSGQTLTALKISIELLRQKLDNGEGTREELRGIALLADEALQEIRTTSYLLHPPLLDEVGFTSAAQWYVEGFARRSGMKVRIELEPPAERLPNTIETALFRVLQESLTNVHRHSGASEVEVRFLRAADAVILEVRDYGRGIPQELLSRLGQSVRDSGVGLSGMCERLNELEGDLEITSADPGTRLRAIVPLSSRAVAHAAPMQLLRAAATNRAIYQPCRTFMARAGKVAAFTRSTWATLNRAKHIPLNVGRWETAVCVAAVLVIACWIGFTDRRPPSPSGISELQRSNALEQQMPFAPVKRVLANSTSQPQTALGLELGERRTSRTMPRRLLDRNIRVWYFSDDVTVRYFTPQSPPQPVPDRNIRVRHISEDVTVLYLSPNPAGAPSSTPNGSPARSVSR
jgi:anti-sigma regulatory factor (Ser/Thr protein kinase)